MIDALLEEGAIISAYDPEAMPNVQNIYGAAVNFADDEYSVLSNADALIICTEWGIFRNPDFNQMKLRLKDNVIFDGRNLFDLDDMNDKGFYYSSIGRNLIQK